MQTRKGRKAPYVVQVRDEIGRVQTFSFVKKRDAEECERNLRSVRQRILAGLERPQSKRLFFDVAADFLKKRVAMLPAPTWKNDESKLRRVILPVFGQRLISQITTKDIQVFLDSLRFGDKPLSPASVNRYRALLSTLFAAAIDDELLTLNPVSRVPLLSEKIKSRKMDHWKTAEEVTSFVTAAYQSSEVFGIWADIMVWTGMRVNESVPLRWQDISFDDSTIRVSRIFEIVTGNIVDRTKGQGAGGHRIVPLFDNLAVVLKTWRLKSPHSKPSDFILAKPDGKNFTYWEIEGRYQRVIAASEIKKIRIHDIRHAFASLAQEAGFSAVEIQDMLGHENAKTTQGYMHVDRKHLLSKARKFGFGETRTSQEHAESK